MGTTMSHDHTKGWMGRHRSHKRNRHTSQAQASSSPFPYSAACIIVTSASRRSIAQTNCAPSSPLPVCPHGTSRAAPGSTDGISPSESLPASSCRQGCIHFKSDWPSADRGFRGYSAHSFARMTRSPSPAHRHRLKYRTDLYMSAWRSLPCGPVPVFTSYHRRFRGRSAPQPSPRSISHPLICIISNRL